MEESNQLKNGIKGIESTYLRDVVQSITDPSIWVHRPIMIKRSVDMLNSSLSPVEKLSAIRPLVVHHTPANENVITIDNEFFVGVAFIAIAGLSTSPTEIFSHHERKLQFLIQGRFKTQLRCADVQTGQAFTSPLENIPAKWLIPVIVRILKSFQPDLKLCVDGVHPYALSSLMATSQNIVISKPGEEPNIYDPLDVHEDLSLLGSQFINMSVSNRKHYFANKENAEKHNFEPEYVYTFDFFQHVLDLSSFKVKAAIFEIDILSVLGLRPVQIMACILDPYSTDSITPARFRFLFNFEVWHEKAPPPASFVDLEIQTCLGT